MRERDEICLVGRGRFEVRFSVVPGPEACEIDAVLAEDFYEVLLDGARALAYDLSGKPWSDPSRGQEYRRRFLAGLAAAKIEQLARWQRGRIKVDWGQVL